LDARHEDQAWPIGLKKTKRNTNFKMLAVVRFCPVRQYAAFRQEVGRRFFALLASDFRLRICYCPVMNVEASTTCLIAFGGNQGDPQERLRTALQAMEQVGFDVQQVSRPMLTKAVGGPLHQPDYLNAAILANTQLSVESAVEALLAAERICGRVRNERWGPRGVDLDLLLYGEKISESQLATVPHPRMTLRRFVLEPANEIAPTMREPISGRTIAELLEHLNSPSRVFVWWVQDRGMAGQVIERLSALPEPQWVVTEDEPGRRHETLSGFSNCWELVLAETLDAVRNCTPHSRLVICDSCSPRELIGLVQGPYLCLKGDAEDMVEELLAATVAMS
jgi:2-amino-4-hydroxy-6-hydroxymethyldihydropteridine diphosphokinase